MSKTEKKVNKSKKKNLKEKRARTKQKLVIESYLKKNV